ncbi:MAG TPA: hypothetical protein VFY93_02800 [Planctomycetota bacterium]|nr:hypothetical protein [Planctomycetota bacterium]
MKLAATLLLLAPALVAEDLPLIRAMGTSLETFEVELRLDAVDRKTPEGLAKSFARFEEEEHGVRRKFAELVRDEHLALLRVFFAKDLVDKQAQAYDAVEQRGFRSETKDVRIDGDKATAELKRTYIVGGREREDATELDLVHDAAGWWIRTMRVRGRDGKLVDRPLSPPPVLKRPPIPAPGAPDLSDAQAAMLSLRDHVLRFGALRDNASLSLTEKYFDIIGAFYGPEVAKKARESRPTLPDAAPVALDFGAAAPRLSDLMRVEVLVVEDARGKRNPIGGATFDLRAEDGKWKVVGEYHRNDPDAPPQAVSKNFALFFLVRR